MTFDFSPLFLTFQLAIVTTILLVVVGAPLAYWLAFSRRAWKAVVEPIVSLPLVLPPTVLGFYILILFSPRYPLGRFLETYFDVRVVFTFLGLVIGSVVFSLPFMVNPVKAGFQNVPKRFYEAAYTLGKSEWETLVHVMLPHIRPALLTGIVMSFAHTLGEFGVVLMVGGNIPGQTRVASIAIFSQVEAMNYTYAHIYALVLLGISFAILFVLHRSHRKALRIF